MAQDEHRTAKDGEVAPTALIEEVELPGDMHGYRVVTPRDRRLFETFGEDSPAWFPERDVER